MELTNNSQSNDAGSANAPQKSSIGSLFSDDKKKSVDNSGAVSELSTGLKNMTNRMRTIEEKYRNLKNEFQLNEKNSLDDHKKSSVEFRDLNDQIFTLKKSFNEVKNKMDIIIKELELTAKKESVLTIQKYLDLWNPVNFVSQLEIKDVVRRALLDMGITSADNVRKVDDVTKISDSNELNRDSDTHETYEPDLRS